MAILLLRNWDSRQDLDRRAEGEDEVLERLNEWNEQVLKRMTVVTLHGLIEKRVGRSGRMTATKKEKYKFISISTCLLLNAPVEKCQEQILFRQTWSSP